MRAHALEENCVSLDSINEQPVGFDMAITTTNKATDKTVIAVNWIEPFTCQQVAHDELEFVQIFTAQLATFEILSKLPCRQVCTSDP